MAKKLFEVSSLTVLLEREGLRLELVKDISFSLYANETLALVGESGSGKTTTANAILRLLPQKAGFSTLGSVEFEGKNILKVKEKTLQQIRGAKISMIFQDPASALNPVFPIGSQIAEVFDIHEFANQEEAEVKTIQALEKVGLSSIEHPFDTYPHQLSGGMKQRVMIAMALALGPRILIADEPTSALDLTVQKEILELLKHYLKDHSMALFLITHDFTVVERLADRVAVMYVGEIVEEGGCKEIFENPAHPYTQALMKARPTKENRKKILPAVAGIISKTNVRIGCPFQERCPYVMEKCCTAMPPVIELSSTHKTRCWLHEDQ